MCYMAKVRYCKKNGITMQIYKAVRKNEKIYLDILSGRSNIDSWE